MGQANAVDPTSIEGSFFQFCSAIALRGKPQYLQLLRLICTQFRLLQAFTIQLAAFLRTYTSQDFSWTTKNKMLDFGTLFLCHRVTTLQAGV